MTWAKLERLAPLSGVLAVALWVLGMIIVNVIGDVPDDSAPAEAFVSYYDKEEGSIFIGTAVIALGVAAFLWFLGSLRAALREAEGGTGRLSAVSFGAGIAMSILLASSGAGDASGVAALSYLDRDLSPEAAETLSVLGDGFFYMTILMALPFFLATGVVALRFHSLPTWLGWVTVLLGVSMFTPINWIFFIFGLPIWVLIVSLLLYFKGRSAATTTVAA